MCGFVIVGCGEQSATKSKVQNTQSNIYAKKSQQLDRYSYIPKGVELTDKMAFKFLSLSTFGPTQADVEHLKKLGVVGWVEEQLEQKYDNHKDSLTYQCMTQSIEFDKEAFAHPIEYYYKEDTPETFSSIKEYPYNYRRYFFGNWLRQTTKNKKQLRLRVAYALSQIIVAADSNDMFGRKYTALGAYYDLLIKHAFGNYGNLLKDISTNPAMGYYLTFYGNQKKHKSKKGEDVYPDENYAREVMQLFSIGAGELLDDGTFIQQNAGSEQFKPTYTQEDVKEMSRVMTGLDFRLRQPRLFGVGGFNRETDLIHKMECYDQYHDSGEKTILGHKIPAGGNCYEDINKAMDILMQSHNVAPFISRHLIMRLTKSNPKSDYIARVSAVFNDNGKGVKGDLKAVVKAILLDKELWDKKSGDIVNNRVMKFKEPILAFTQMLRLLKTSAMPKWHIQFSRPENLAPVDYVVEDRDYFDFFKLVYIFNQGPASAQSVFNFYSNNYIPNDPYFMVSSFVAPEVEIQVDGFFVSYHNYITQLIGSFEKHYILNPYGIGPGAKVYHSLKEYGESLPNNYVKILFDMGEYYDLAETIIKAETGLGLDASLKSNKITDATKKKVVQSIIDKFNKEFLGGTMSKDFQDYLFDKHTKTFPTDIKVFYHAFLQAITLMIVTSDDYMVQ